MVTSVCLLIHHGTKSGGAEKGFGQNPGCEIIFHSSSEILEISLNFTNYYIVLRASCLLALVPEWSKGSDLVSFTPFAPLTLGLL